MIRHIEKIFVAGLLIGFLISDVVGLHQYEGIILVSGTLLAILYLTANWWTNTPMARIPRTIAVTIIYGVAFCGLTLSVLFSLLFLPGSSELTLLSASLTVLAILIDLISAWKRQRVINRKAIVRLSILTPILVILTLVPEDKRIRFTYRKDQDFLKYYEINKENYPTFFDLQESHKTSCDKVIETFTNGEPRIVHFYKNCADSSIFAHRRYYESGQMATEAWHDSSLEYTEHKWWHKNGQLQSSWREIDGEEHGQVIVYYDNGKIRQERFLEKGVETGVHRRWYRNGRPMDSGYVKADKKQGFWVFYDSVGLGGNRENYLDDQLNGITRVFASNGQLVLELSYVNGKKTGDYKAWDTLGILIEHRVLRNDSIQTTIVGDD